MLLFSQFILQFQLELSFILKPPQNKQQMKIADNHIIDRYFYECLKKIEDEIKGYIIFFTFRTISLLIAIPVDYFILSSKQSSSISVYLIFLLSFLAMNTIELFINIFLYYAKLKNKETIVKIAENFKHCRSLHDQRYCKLSQENMDDTQTFQIQEIFGLKVSTEYYDYENLQKINDVSEQYKSTRQKDGQNNIKTQIEKNFFCYRFIYCLLQFSSFGLFVFGIVTSTSTQINQLEHNFLELLIISEILFKPKIYCLVFALVALPFILVFVCIYLCFCKKQKKANLPNKVKANAQIISKCSQCAICFQNYDLQQQVIVLQCSQMHVFHEICIKGWTNVKPSCPICRKNLSQS